MGEILNVDKILDELVITEDMNAAEFGCGMGLFSLKLASRLKKGRVYALDVQEEKLSALKSKFKQEQINNIVTILCDLEVTRGSTLPDQSLDIVLIPNVLFQAENKHAMIEEAKRVLKPQGQLLIIDWAKKAPFGAKGSIISADEMRKLLGNLNLTLKKEFCAGEYHYGLLSIKP